MYLQNHTENGKTFSIDPWNFDYGGGDEKVAELSIIVGVEQVWFNRQINLLLYSAVYQLYLPGDGYTD